MTVGLSKALTALLVAVLAALGQAVGAGGLDDLGGYEWVEVAGIILGGSALVAVVENVQGGLGTAIRAVIGAATAGLSAWQVAYDNGEPAQFLVTQGEWIGVAIAVVTALSAVYQKTERRVTKIGGPVSSGAVLIVLAAPVALVLLL